MNRVGVASRQATWAGEIDSLESDPGPVFLNFYEAQQSIPRNRFRQPMQLGGPVRQSYSYQVPSPHRLFKNSSSGLLKIKKYCLRLHVGWRAGTTTRFLAPMHRLLYNYSTVQCTYTKSKVIGKLIALSTRLTIGGFIKGFLRGVRCTKSLKGQCHKIFRLWFFFINQFPPSPRVSH